MERIIISADRENNADEFWTNLEAIMPVVAAQLRGSDEVSVSESTWESIQRIPGFSGGPAYAPNALVAK